LSFEGEGRVVFYEGNYTLYRELRAQALKCEDKRGEGNGRGVSAPVAVRERPRKKGLTFAERQELERVEAEIAHLELRTAEVEAALADPTAYAGTPGGIAALSSELAHLGEELEVLLVRWEELETKRSEG
ncbi:ABC transporter, partial [bacterium]|nr:ABC transporter [bacterium]